MKFILAVFSFSTLVVSVSAEEPTPPSPWERRAAEEREWRSMGFTLIPHKSNYFFPFTYNTSPHATTTNEAQSKEAKYQFSFKVLLMDKVFDPSAHLYFGYTQLSMWQVYDRERSAPFRDINHEPEVMLTMDAAQPWGSVTLREMDFGISHQSNGLTQPDSRGWNRLYARFLFDHDNIAWSFKPWVRIPTSDDHDNRDIYKFMGYGEVTVSLYKRHHVWSAMVRNNMRFDKNRGAVQLEYSFPLTNILTGLVQYFSGYGESLLDYNRANNRFSAGLALSSW